MKDLIASDEATIEALTARLKQAKGIAEFQRVQCVLMRVALGSSAAEIAQVLGWATATVHVMHSRWARQGEAMFDLKGLGWAQPPEPDRAAGRRISGLLCRAGRGGQYRHGRGDSGGLRGPRGQGSAQQHDLPHA